MQLGRCAVGGSKVITMNNAGNSLDGDHDGGRFYLPSIAYIVHVLRNAGLDTSRSISFGLRGLLNGRHQRITVIASRSAGHNCNTSAMIAPLGLRTTNTFFLSPSVTVVFMCT